MLRDSVPSIEAQGERERERENLRDLDSLSLFSCSTEASLSAIVAACRRRDALARRQLYAAGQPSPGLFGILSGRVMIKRPAVLVSPELGGRGAKLVAAPQPVFLELRGPGDVLGLASLVLGGLCSASADTLEPCRLLRVPAAAFQQWRRDDPGAAGTITRFLAERDEARAEHERRRYRLAPARISDALLRYSQPEAGGSPSARLRFTLSRGDLALIAGTTRETVSRVLRLLEAQGIIERPQGSIWILDPERLRRLAEQ